VIFDNYSDKNYAREAQKEVDAIRTSASKYGAVISTLAFVSNELARVTMRSPLFKLKPWNAVFWLVGPTLICKYSMNSKID
jgi:hypothetical protein